MMNILLAKKEHLPLVATIEKEVFSEPWSENALELFLTEKAFCVCCFEEKLVSYCTLIMVLDEAQIVNVATSKEFRSKGYAKSVLEAVLCECRDRNIKFISLEVRESNIPAISLYQSLGFTVEGNRKDFYKNPRENALVMIKNLD